MTLETFIIPSRFHVYFEIKSLEKNNIKQHIKHFTYLSGHINYQNKMKYNKITAYEHFAYLLRHFET